MKVTVGELRRIISEAKRERWTPTPEQKKRWEEQNRIRSEFEDRAETFLAEVLPRLRDVLEPIQDEAREIMLSLEGWPEPSDEVDGYMDLMRLVELDIDEMLHGSPDQGSPPSDPYHGDERLRASMKWSDT